MPRAEPANSAGEALQEPLLTEAETASVNEGGEESGGAEDEASADDEGSESALPTETSGGRGSGGGGGGGAQSSGTDEGGDWSPDQFCVVCFELPRGARLPCGHDDFCTVCVEKFDTCPLCRAPTGRVRPQAARASANGTTDPAAARRRRLRHGNAMRHRGGATCFAAVLLLMLYTLVLFILDTTGVDVRCRGLPLVPGGLSESTCIEEFSKKYGQCSQGVCLMAPAYVLSGCASSRTRHFCGTYLRIDGAYCQGSPVYLKNGRRGENVLFRTRTSSDEFSVRTQWAVGPNMDMIDGCVLGGDVYMMSGPSDQPRGPDYPGYTPWLYPTPRSDPRFVVQPSEGLKDPLGLCRGVVCGDPHHSACVIDQEGLPSCKCTGNQAGSNCAKSCGHHGTSNGYTCECHDGYIGEFCDEPLPTGFANSYALTVRDQ